MRSPDHLLSKVEPKRQSIVSGTSRVLSDLTVPTSQFCPSCQPSRAGFRGWVIQSVNEASLSDSHDCLHTRLVKNLQEVRIGDLYFFLMG